MSGVTKHREAELRALARSYMSEGRSVAAEIIWQEIKRLDADEQFVVYREQCIYLAETEREKALAYARQHSTEMLGCVLQAIDGAKH